MNTSKNRQKTLELLGKFSRHTEDELDALKQMNREELDAELAEAGIDFPRFYANIQQTINQHAEMQEKVNPLQKGIDIVHRKAQQFTRLTLDAMEDLHRICAPVMLRGQVPEDALLQKLQAEGTLVIIESLNPSAEGIKLTLRWLDQAPQKTPTVEVCLRGNPVDVDHQWLDWAAGEPLSQSLSLKGSTIQVDHELFGTWDDPALDYQWDRASNRLWLDLKLPI